MATRSRPALQVSLHGSTVDVTPGQPWYVGIGADCNIRLPLTGPAEPWFVIRHAGVWTVRCVDTRTRMWVDGVAVPSDRSVRVGTAPRQDLRVSRGSAEVTLTLSTGVGAGAAGPAPAYGTPVRPAGTDPRTELSRSAAQFLTWASGRGWPGFRPLPGTSESGLVVRRTLVSGSRSVEILPGTGSAGRSVYALVCPDGGPLPGDLRDEGLLITSAGRLLAWSVTLPTTPAVLDAPPPPQDRCLEYPKRPHELPEVELWHLLDQTARSFDEAPGAGAGPEAGPVPHPVPAPEPASAEPAPAEPPSAEPVAGPATSAPAEPPAQPAQPADPPAAQPAQPARTAEPPAPESEPVSLRQWNTPASVVREHPTGPTPVDQPPPVTEPAALASTPTQPAPPPVRSAEATAETPPVAPPQRPRPAWWHEPGPFPGSVASIAHFMLIMQKGGWPGAISLPGAPGTGVVLGRVIKVGDVSSEVEVMPGADLGPTVYERFRPNGGRFPPGLFREEGIVLGADGRLYHWELPMERYAHVFDAPPEPLGPTLRRELRPLSMDEDELLPLLNAALSRATRLPGA